MANSVGENIRMARKALKMSQTQLAKVSGISQSAISDIENPNVTKKPNVDTVSRIAAALHTTVSALMGESPEDEKEPAEVGGQSETGEEAKIMNVFRQLSENQRDFLLRTAEVLLQSQRDASDSPR